MEAKNLDLIAIHGWGGGDWIWQFLEAKLPSSIVLHTSNREGCFSASLVSNEVSNNIGIITHSFGLHFIPKNILQKAKFVFVLSGFINFLSSCEIVSRKQKQVLSLLLRKYVRNPQQTVADFYYNMLPFDIKLPFSSLYNSIALQNELQSLATTSLDTSLFPRSLDVYMLYGNKDTIVPSICWEELQQNIPQATSYLVANTGHASFASEEAINIACACFKKYIN